MNIKLKEATIKEAITALATGNVTITDFYIYEEDIGYVQINEFFILENNDIEMGNHVVDIRNDYKLDDKIFIKTIDN